MAKTININGVRFGGRNPLALIAGPCVVESRKGCLDLARRLKKLAGEKNIPFVFKASYDKANRTSADSFRSLGFETALEILREVKETCDVP
ncbi:MAG: 3-deoxy-8-phosphooctulonate synthase, partial [Verrucomicrobiota bacterium]